MCRFGVLWACLVCGLVMPWSAAVGQQEQVLQYRVTEDSPKAFGQYIADGTRLSTTTPEGIRLPTFKDPLPMFCKWVSPMAKGGFRWVAIARSLAKGPYDLLYMDTNGDGNLDDEAPLKGSTERVDTVWYARFKPVRMVLDGPDGPAIYHISVHTCTAMDNTWCFFRPACWYEGEISIDGSILQCRLLDGNSNGAFNDELDWAVVDDRKGNFSRLRGRGFVDVNGTLYALDVAQDGARVRFKKAEDVRCGRLRVPQQLVSLTILGDQGEFRLVPRERAYVLPVGTYYIRNWSMKRLDAAGRVWTAEARVERTSRNHIELLDGKEVLPSNIGEPFVCKVQARTRADVLVIQQQLIGHMGEAITLLVNGKRPAPPSLDIRDSTGGYEKDLSFSYG